MKVTLSPIGPEELDAIQEVIASDPGFAERTTGMPPQPSDAQHLLTERPPQLPEDRKLVYGVRTEAGALIGLVDLLRGYPDEHIAWIGLLQLRPDQKGRGVGRSAHDAVLAVVRGWPEVRAVRLAVVGANRAVADPFWRSLGYKPLGGATPYHLGKLDSTVQRYELVLDGL